MRTELDLLLRLDEIENELYDLSGRVFSVDENDKKLNVIVSLYIAEIHCIEIRLNKLWRRR